MPESVTDRPTKSHEYVFLLTKSPRYYYDAQAIAEPVAYLETLPRVQFSSRRAGAINREPSGNEAGKEYLRPERRNRRSVWTINTMPYAGAHFATMPEKLVEPCILAGCPMGGLVLDPFSGSGTVLAVAERLGRRGVGVDLNPAYHELAKVRTAQRGLRFGTDGSEVDV
jgi:DNA modification methylase